MAKRSISKGNSAAATKSLSKKVQKLWAKKFSLEQERLSLEAAHARAIGRIYERLAEVDGELSEQVLLRERLLPAGVKRGPGRPPGSVSAKKSGRRGAGGGKRSPRGQNLARVTEFLKSQSTGASQADIARETGINPAIISLLVKRHADQFRREKGRGGLIRLGR